MFLKQSPYKMLFGLSLALSFTSAQANNFTYNETWQLPATQQCDNWSFVAFPEKVFQTVLRLHESRKVSIAIPEDAIRATISLKSHASEPSISITKTNYTDVCNTEDVSRCIGNVIPVVNTGSGDSLAPKTGSNIGKVFSIEPDDTGLFIYQLNKEDPQNPGVTANVGASSMFALNVQFQLTPEACAKRAGVTLEDEQAEEPAEEVVIVDLESYKQAFTPVILTPELNLHLNRIAYGGKTWASDLAVLTAEEFREMAEMAEGEEEGIFKHNGKIFFAMDLSEDVTYEVLDGINEDNDGDGSSIIDGDCNDNDPSVHPKAEEAGKNCSLVE